MPSYTKARVVAVLVEFFGDDFRRIEHALSVLKRAEEIGEGRSGWDYDVLVVSALLHDVGIKPSEEKLGYNNGRTQEEYGPPEARRLLRGVGLEEDKIHRVCEIIGNHHSRSRFDYVELDILKQADRIVNKAESDTGAERRS